MGFGFKEIIDLSPLSIKNLNDQLYLLWKKVLGGISENDILTGESEKIVLSGLSSISLGVDAVSGTNLVYNGRGNYGTESYSVTSPGSLTTTEDTLINRSCFLAEGEFRQTGLPLTPGEGYIVGCYIDTNSEDVMLTVWCQLANSSTIAQDVLAVEETINTDGFEKKHFSFTAPNSIKSAYVSFSGEALYKVTDIQLKEGATYSEWTAHEGEVYSSSIQISEDRVQIATPNFELNILDPHNPDPENPMVTMSASSGGFSKLVAQEIEVAGNKLVHLDDSVYWFYVNPSHTAASDANDGTDSSLPLFTIGEALRRVGRVTNQPVIIYIASGTTYREQIEVKGFQNHITFASYDGLTNPIIYCTGTTGVVVESCSMVTFRDIDFYAFFTEEPDYTEVRGDYYAISIRYSNAEIENSRFYCHIANCGAAVEVVFSKVMLREYIINDFKHAVVTRHTSTFFSYNGRGRAEYTFINIGCRMTYTGTKPYKILYTLTNIDNATEIGKATSVYEEPPIGVTTPDEYVYYASFSGSWGGDEIMTSSPSNIRQGEDANEQIYTGVFGFNLTQMRSDLAGKTIKNVYLRLARCYDLQSVRDIHLWGCDKIDISGDVPEKTSGNDYGFVSKFNGGDSSVLFGLNASIVESMISEETDTPNSLMLFDDWYSPLIILGYDQLDSLRPMLRVCV
ncbi:MAG: hypothetical protein AB1Z19_05410 [Eubacteriales bacterium]